MKKEKNSLDIYYKFTILVLMIIAVVLLFRLKTGVTTIDPNIRPIEDDTQLTGMMSENGIWFIGFKRMEIASNKRNVRVYLVNPKENKVNLVASIYLADGTLLYRSDKIPVGYAIYDARLNFALDSGNYDAIIKYEAFESDGKQVNGAVLNFELIVK